MSTNDSRAGQAGPRSESGTYSAKSKEALKRLHAAGAHLVLTKGKRPVAKGWQRTPATLEAVLEHAGKGGDRQIGLVPASLGLLALDFDRAPIEAAGKTLDVCVEEVERAFGPYLASQRTASGAVHAFYRAADGRGGNRTWAYGDVRQSAGQVILYSPERIAAALPIANGPPFPLTELLRRFPEAKKAKAGGEAGDGQAEEGGEPKGGRNISLWKRVFLAWLVFDGKAVERARAIAGASGLEAGEIDQTVSSAKKTADEARKNRLLPTKNRLAFEAALKLKGVELRLNVRSNRIESRRYARHGKGRRWTPWNVLPPIAAARLFSDIETEFRVSTGRSSRGKGEDKGEPLRFSADQRKQYTLAACWKAQVDPFRDEYLAGLEPWDGVTRCERVLIDHFRAGDTKLNRWASLALFLGPVQRAFEPGCKLDETVVLQGKQGVGKSALLASMFAEPQRDFRDNFSLAEPHQRQVEGLLGPVVIELAELDGLGRAETSRVKAFLTSTVDSVRHAYGEFREDHPRRVTFTGTTDKPRPLPNDGAGNRRFVVAGLGTPHGPVEAFMKDNRRQLWAEAVARYKSGERANLPRALQAEQRAVNEEHRGGNALLESALMRLAPAPNGKLMMDLKREAGVDATAASLEAGLRALGWHTGDGRKRRRDGSPPSLWWYSPEDWKERAVPY